MGKARSLRIWTAALVTATFLIAPSQSYAAPRIELRVSDTSAIPNDTGLLGIYLTNRQDTVSGFEVTLLLDKDNLIGFLPFCDTTNAITSGWEYLAVRLVTSPHPGIKFVGFYSLSHPPYLHPGIPPSSQRRLLFKVPFYAKWIPDSDTDRTVTISIADTVTDFGIATNEGQLVGLLGDTLWDTTCYKCTQRDSNNVCQAYTPGSPPCDSIAVALELLNPHFDPAAVSLFSGSLTLLSDCHPIPLAGDVDGSGVVDEGDLSFLRYFVQYGRSPIPSPANADLNQDCCIDWKDYAILESYLAAPGTVTLPSCVCSHPIRCCCSGRRGNVNNDRSEVVDLSDLSTLVAYLTSALTVLPCQLGADFDGNGIVDSADLSRMVAYLTGGTTSPASCP
jgi:hypothetical protein